MRPKKSKPLWSYCDNISQTEWLIINLTVFLTALEAGSPRWKCQRGRLSEGPLPGSDQCLFSVFTHTLEEAVELSGAPFIRRNPTEEGSTLMNSAPLKCPTF